MNGSVPKMLTEEADCELYESEGHGLVARVDTSQYQQHRADLACRVDEDEDGEEDEVDVEVVAVERTVAGLRRPR